MTRNPNSGHGHVFPRPDGVKARCGGPAICQVCAADFARAARERLNPDQRLGDAPIVAEHATRMQAVADVLHETFNGPGVPISQAKVAFVLMVFPTGQPDGRHRCNYIATANRQDVISLLREQLAYFEGMPPQEPGRA